MLNSKYDSWQGPAIIGCSTALEACPAAAQTYWVAYGQAMVAAAAALPPQHGAFIANCRAHCQTGTASAWNGTTVGGVAMGAAFKAWYDDTPGSHRHVEACPGNDGPCGADKCSNVTTCAAALAKYCPGEAGKLDSCLACLKEHPNQLFGGECTHSELSDFCGKTAPPCPKCPPPAFAGGGALEF